MRNENFNDLVLSGGVHFTTRVRWENTLDDPVLSGEVRLMTQC
jgi:hypothetical protein